MKKTQSVKYGNSANIQVKASHSNAKRKRKKGTFAPLCNKSESQQFFQENPFVKSMERSSPSAGANVC